MWFLAGNHTVTAVGCSMVTATTASDVIVLNIRSKRRITPILWSELCASTASFLSACQLVVDPFSGVTSLK